MAYSQIKAAPPLQQQEVINLAILRYNLSRQERYGQTKVKTMDAELMRRNPTIIRGIYSVPLFATKLNEQPAEEDRNENLIAILTLLDQSKLAFNKDELLATLTTPRESPSRADSSSSVSFAALNDGFSTPPKAKRTTAATYDSLEYARGFHSNVEEAADEIEQGNDFSRRHIPAPNIRTPLKGSKNTTHSSSVAQCFSRYFCCWSKKPQDPTSERGIN